MRAVPPRFVLDSNVFIEAHKRYYAFDICPGYWDALIAHHGGGRVVSIDRVRDELVGQGDALSQWVQQLPGPFFAGTGDPAIAARFGSIMTWLQAQPQYLAPGKAAIAAGKDGWLIAYAKEQMLIIATDDARNTELRRIVPLPNVSDVFVGDCL